MARERRLLASDAGYSLPELLVAITIALIVAAGGATLLMIAMESQPRAGDRSSQIQQGRTMIESITRELRQGETVFNATASGFQILTYVHATSCGGAAGPTARLCRVTYSCTTDSCTRTERSADGSGSAAPVRVVDGVTGPSVFTYQGPLANPTYIGVNLVFADEEGEETVTLADGAELRNYVELTG
jgi:prepilin-type N-terminal cleavage/methylation domain-containing protein